MKKKNVFLLGMLVMVLVFGMTVSGCGTDPAVWAAIGDGMNNANNSFANSYSSSSETGMIYTIYNRSSVTVTIWDATGEISIPPGGSVSARFNSSATIYNVYYSPSSVNVSQSGYSFTFTN